MLGKRTKLFPLSPLYVKLTSTKYKLLVSFNTDKSTVRMYCIRSDDISEACLVQIKRRYGTCTKCKILAKARRPFVYYYVLFIAVLRRCGPDLHLSSLILSRAMSSSGMDVNRMSITEKAQKMLLTSSKTGMLQCFNTTNGRYCIRH